MFTVNRPSSFGATWNNLRGKSYAAKQLCIPGVSRFIACGYLLFPQIHYRLCMAKNAAQSGGILAGAGCIFGLAPLLISLAAAAVGSDIGNTLHWYTLFTAPIGAIVVIVGLIRAIVASTKSQPEDFASALPKSRPSSALDDGSTSRTESTVGAMPPLPVALARLVKVVYAVGFGILLVSCVLRVAVFQSFAGILTLFDLMPVFFSGWFVVLARKAEDGLNFLRLHQAQRLVSIAGCVVGLYPLLMLESNISMLSDSGIDRFQWGGTIITGLIPFAASVVSLVFAEIARARYRRSIAKP
jgi:hypothetical protein